MITTIEPQHFKTLKLASDAIILDVRDRKEQYEEGQISGDVILEMGTQYFYDQLGKIR